MNELMVLFYPTNIYFSPLQHPLNVLKLKDWPLSYFILARLQLESPELKNLPRRPHKIGYLPRCDMRILLNTFPKTTDENLTSFLGRIIPQAKNKKIEKLNNSVTNPFADHLYKRVLSHFTLRDKPKQVVVAQKIPKLSVTENLISYQR